LKNIAAGGNQPEKFLPGEKLPGEISQKNFFRGEIMD
jgi:hypothetical protein